MQKFTADELQGFRSEFEMTCAAQDGDGKAWMALWNHYRALMMSRLIAAKGFSRDELESEACDVFAHKLEIFNRKKVNSEAAYSMFSWLFCGTINRTNKLIRQRKKDVHLYFEKVNANSNASAGSVLFEDWEDVNSVQNQMRGVNDEVYSTYNPEKLVVESLHDDDIERVKVFYAKLTQFERDILEARRGELTLADIAKKFCCSVTTVKNHIRAAKLHAEDIFQVCYA
jgi:DNA-directed RNA polymerase specialized sigma24 family protein